MKENRVFSIFTQASNNCVPVALIKASIDKFGIGKVYKKLVIQNNSYKITLRSGKEIIITFKEFHKIISSISIDIELSKKDPVPALASLLHEINLLYAIIVKSAVKIGYIDEYDDKEPIKNLKEAIDLVTHEGLCTDHAHKYLGLNRGQIYNYNISKISKMPASGVIMYNCNHTVAVSHRKFDNYSDMENLSGKIAIKQKFEWYYILS